MKTKNKSIQIQRKAVFNFKRQAPVSPSGDTTSTTIYTIPTVSYTCTV